MRPEWIKQKIGSAVALLILCVTTTLGCYEALEVNGDVYVLSRLDGSVCRYEKAMAKLDIDPAEISADRIASLMRGALPVAWQTDSVKCLARADLEAEIVPFERSE